MSKIIKTKYYCKGTSRTAPRGSTFGNIQWSDRFVEGKWYEGSYEIWYDEDEDSERNKEMCRLNGLGGVVWRRYTVINEQGKEEEISKAHMGVIFEMNIERIRDQKLEQILKNK